MRYMIFGCGSLGKEALQHLGTDHVLCFASNHAREGRQVCGKDVISFSEMERIYKENKDVTVVIATNGFREKLEAQTRDAGIQRYFIYQDMYHGYTVDHAAKMLSFSEIVGNFDFAGYRKIGVYGENRDEMIGWAVEIRRQSPEAEVFIIPAVSCSNTENFPFPVISLEEADTKIDCLCVAVSLQADPAAIRDRFLTKTAPYPIIDLLDIERFEPAFHYQGLERFKNIHAGKRIFMIGNGPSLTVEDLNILHDHGEICMAFNKVYRVYDQTPWRPDYLGFTDGFIIDDCIEDIPRLPGTIFMVDSFQYSEIQRFPNVQYVHVSGEEYVPNFPRFSEDPSQCTYWGYSVIYDIGLQLAAYMGFREIYLLGVDHSIYGSVTAPENHFIKNYFTAEEASKERSFVKSMDEATKSFEKAELYSRSHGFRIFNATRGGKLEVFERVDFDSLFAD